MDKNCENCTGCSGNCGGCGGCGSSLTITTAELQVLQVLQQLPFLPVARRADEETPVSMEQELANIPHLSVALTLLEKKALIDLDYRTPLKGFAYLGYEPYACKGTMALTARGQQVLELLELQGAGE